MAQRNADWAVRLAVAEFRTRASCAVQAIPCTMLSGHSAVNVTTASSFHVGWSSSAGIGVSAPRRGLALVELGANVLRQRVGVDRRAMHQHAMGMTELMHREGILHRVAAALDVLRLVD